MQSSAEHVNLDFALDPALTIADPASFFKEKTYGQLD